MTFNIHRAKDLITAYQRRTEDALDGLMRPIGGGNPYWHCTVCGVTNVQLNSGANSRKHREGCYSRVGGADAHVAMLVEAVAEIERLERIAASNAQSL